LLESDVLLDVALAREPHVKVSAVILRRAESGGDAAVAWHTLKIALTFSRVPDVPSSSKSLRSSRSLR
jgi:hypothetical protein